MPPVLHYRVDRVSEKFPHVSPPDGWREGGGRRERRGEEERRRGGGQRERRRGEAEEEEEKWRGGEEEEKIKRQQSFHMLDASETPGAEGGKPACLHAWKSMLWGDTV